MTAGVPALLLSGPPPWHRLQWVDGKGAASLEAWQEAVIASEGRERNRSHVKVVYGYETM